MLDNRYIDPVTIKQINSLADFGLDSGVGRKMPMKMGMTRRLPNF